MSPGPDALSLRAQPKPAPVTWPEATVADIHRALDARAVTCRQVVQAYLDRIDAYDRRGPSLRALIAVNPRALEEADRLDREAARGAERQALHCIPLILKDNFDTADMPTTGASVTLARSVPPDDAFVVKRFRAAGAIIIAKANLTELALTGVTVSSLGGQTLNPYDLTRTPGGSSGGTGAAIAAGFGVLGTGSDTGQSIRSPASANSIVGLRPTRGLVSRDGIMPFSVTQDEVGPMTRTVEDAARMLEVMAGYDSADPITAFGIGRIPASYRAALEEDARAEVAIMWFRRDLRVDDNPALAAALKYAKHVVSFLLVRPPSLSPPLSRSATAPSPRLRWPLRLHRPRAPRTARARRAVRDASAAAGGRFWGGSSLCSFGPPPLFAKAHHPPPKPKNSRSPYTSGPPRKRGSSNRAAAPAGGPSAPSSASPRSSPPWEAPAWSSAAPTTRPAPYCKPRPKPAPRPCFSTTSTTRSRSCATTK